MGIRLEYLFNPMFLKIRDLPVPFITAVKGPAVGFGCALALMGDIIVASESAKALSSSNPFAILDSCLTVEQLTL